MGDTERRIIIPYAPRQQFIAFHDTDKRWRLIVAHRRAGKTVACVNNLIRSALRCSLPSPRVAYVAPLYKQAKDVAWSYLKEFTNVIPGREVNESELRVDMPNGGRVRLYGADNPDALRGIYLDDCVLDEFADMRPRFLPEVIRPALSDRKGSLTIIGTPKGHNEFYDLYELSKTDPEWFSLMLKASETKLVDADELASAAKLMTEAQYDQEYECSFEAAIEGSYYGTLMAKAEAEGRIGEFPFNPAMPVYTGWDLGIRHDSAIWFAQRNGGWYDIIDYHAAKNQDAAYYVKFAKDKPYNYANHYFPHDIDRVDGWVNKTRRIETLKEMGMRDIKVIDRTAIEDGINAVMLLLPRCRFNRATTRDGVEALKQYRREYHEERRTFLKQPHDDWTADSADAFRQLAQGLEPEFIQPPDIPRYSERRRRTYGDSEVSWAN